MTTVPSSELSPSILDDAYISHRDVGHEHRGVTHVVHCVSKRGIRGKALRLVGYGEVLEMEGSAGIRLTDIYTQI